MKLKRLAVCALAACMIGTGAMIHVDAFSLGSVLGGVAKASLFRNMENQLTAPSTR